MIHQFVISTFFLLKCSFTILFIPGIPFSLFLCSYPCVIKRHHLLLAYIPISLTSVCVPVADGVTWVIQGIHTLNVPE
ncbi:hypothetical protein BKA57DRAFT_478024 [Linnemannia elongata]|nr:hypothetical protein BKA57DRAFT_478024 [Linnemannia elongata]